MPDFTNYPIETDPDAVLQEVIDEVRTFFPNWDPNPASLAYRYAAAICRRIAEGRDVAANVPPTIWRAAGGTLFNTPAQEPTNATVDSTWEMPDDDGYSVDQDTLVSIDGTLFQVVDEFVVAPGDTIETPVALVALDAGAAGSGLGSVGGDVVLEESIGFFPTITQVAVTEGGLDAEDIDEYDNRLVAVTQDFSSISILFDDIPRKARQVPGVFAVAVIDNYNLDTNTPGVTGHATVGVRAEAGGAVSGDVKDAVEAKLAGPSARIVGGTVHVTDPTENTINVSFKYTLQVGAVEAEVTPAAEGAVAEFLNKAFWGLPRGSGEGPIWTNKKRISRYDLAEPLGLVEGLDLLTEIKISRGADPLADADLDMVGLFPVPVPGAITGALA